MAYRNNVYLLASNYLAEHIFDIIKETDDNPFDKIKISPEGTTYYFEAVYHTWNETEDGVPKRIMELLAATTDDFTYYRVGEESGDTEYDCHGCPEEGEVYSDGSPIADLWEDVTVDKDGAHVVPRSAIEKFRPLWVELFNKAEAFGLKFKVNLEDAVEEIEK